MGKRTRFDCMESVTLHEVALHALRLCHFGFSILMNFNNFAHFNPLIRSLHNTNQLNDCENLPFYWIFKFFRSRISIIKFIIESAEPFCRIASSKMDESMSSKR